MTVRTKKWLIVVVLVFGFIGVLLALNKNVLTPSSAESYIDKEAQTIVDVIRNQKEISGEDYNRIKFDARAGASSYSLLLRPALEKKGLNVDDLNAFLDGRGLSVRATK